MAEYIEREKAIQTIVANPCKVATDTRKMIAVIERLPTADVVAVVRCKDCKHLMFSDFYGECRNNHLGIVKPWDYCSYGERKDSNNG